MLSRYIIFLLLILAACNSPESPDCLKAAGRTATARYSFASSPKIVEIYDDIDVYLTQDSVAGLTITGGKNLLPAVILEEKTAGHYTIRNTNTCNWVRSYKRKITAQLSLPATLEELHLHGSGEVTGQNRWQTMFLLIDVKASLKKLDMEIAANVLNLKADGYGSEIQIRGSAGECFVETLHFPKIDLSEMKTASGIVKHRAGTDLKMYITDYLWGQIHGTGHLIITTNDFVKNTPAVQTFNTGRLIYQ